VIERYGIRKFHVVAHSMGCTVALALAGYDPSAVQSVTLISPVRHLSDPSSYTFQHIMQPGKIKQFPIGERCEYRPFRFEAPVIRPVGQVEGLKIQKGLYSHPFTCIKKWQFFFMLLYLFVHKI
jgi:pimeloyl-ACP methyl ester carboxylesterase